MGEAMPASKKSGAAKKGKKAEGLKIRKTVLDSELCYLSGVAKTKGTRRGAIPLESVAVKSLSLAGGEVPEPSESVTLKLVSKVDRQAELAKWVEKEGGRVVSSVETGNVLIADLPTKSIKKLDRAKAIQRAEASRVLLPRLDQARGNASRLDAALQAHSLTGARVVFGIVDSGLDWTHPDFREVGGGTRLELFMHAFVPPNSDVSQFLDFDTDCLQIES